MWTELKTLLWLQWKLTRSMFRSRRKSDVMRIVGLLLRILSLLFTLPMFVVMGVGVAVGLILLSPRAAYEVVIILNTGLFFIWLLMPSSASSQMVERFEMSRLFPHPISFRSIVVGSTLMGTLTMTGMWTIPLLAGEVVGLAYHQPLALPMIVVGALPAFAVLALAGRIMDDVFDLVAGDRRLRALAITLFSLPFMLCWLAQYAAQNLDLSNTPIQPLVSQLEKAGGPSEFLEMLNLSRFLMWLPPAWPVAGMGLAARGEWGLAILFLGLSVGGVALLLLGHARITRRLMEGAALSIGVERVRSREWRVRLPGPPAFWALFKKDWLYLWRSPVPRRLIFSSLIMTVAMVLPMRNIGQSDAPSVVRGALPILIGASAITMASMAINMGLASNYFGVIDREGFTTLALSPTDRRYTLLSANLAALLYTSVQVLVISLAFSILGGRWEILPLGVYLGVCLQIGGLPAYTLAAIAGPYRTQLKFTRGTHQRGNLWGILAWVISAPLVLTTLLPYVIWKPLLMITLPLGIAFVLGIYALTLKPLARLLQRREHAILEAITTQE